MDICHRTRCCLGKRSGVHVAVGTGGRCPEAEEVAEQLEVVETEAAGARTLAQATAQELQARLLCPPTTSSENLTSEHVVN